MPTYKNSKQQCIAVEKDDLQGVTQLCIDSLQRHKGRPQTYAEAELDRFMHTVEDYFKMLHDRNADTEQNQQIYPSIESLCVFMGITRDTLWRYGQRNPEWKQCIEQVKTCISAVKMQLACNGRIPQVVAIFDFVNNYGYRNTNQLIVSNEAQAQQDAPTLDTEQITAAIENESTADLPRLPE